MDAPDFEAGDDALALRRNLESLLDLFIHPAWKRLVSQKEEEEKALLFQAVDTVDNERELYYLKGRVAEIRGMLALEITTRSRLDQLDDDERLEHDPFN